jgi:hypothetical protein
MSKIEVNAIEPQCGTNLTVGASGDTITFPSGTTVVNNGSQTGFGRTGTVDWQTGSIKTATFTAANGEGYFANTSGGAFTMNLPAGSAGAIVSVVDYTNTFQTNALTISPNGSEKIGGVAASFIANTEGQSLTFVYVDGTEGWKNVQDSTSNAIGNPFLVATGGTINTCGNCKIHTFTGPGTFTVNNVSTTAAENIVSYMIVAGGGSGGGSQGGGGGGGGGFREIKSPTTPYTASPIQGYCTPANQVTVTAQAYPVVVGAGSSDCGSTGSVGANGSNSSVLGITAAGGGTGGHGGGPADSTTGASGGSGGGGGGRSGNSGGCGNTPSVTPGQGGNGGSSKPEGSPTNDSGGGGGGATDNGNSGQNCSSGGGDGGDGATTSISGSSTTYAGGGGGGREVQGGGAAGPGGGGAGGNAGGDGSNGTDNTGGGGGGSGISPTGGGNGGSGIVIIRYKFQ